MSDIDLSVYLTLAEAGKLVHRSPITLRRWIQSGDLPGTMRLKQQLLIRRDALMAMLKPVDSP